MLALAVALTVGAASTALGATGGDLILGKGDTANAETVLLGQIADTTKAALSLRNVSGGPVLNLQANSGKAPITTNPGAGTATNLSADKLDGKDSTEFAPAGRSPSYVVEEVPAETGKASLGETPICDTGDELLSGGYDSSSTDHVDHTFPQESLQPVGSWAVVWSSLDGVSDAGAGTVLALCEDVASHT